MKKLFLAAFFAFVAFALFASEARCQDLKNKLTVAADGSKISIRADNAPLSQVLARLVEISALDIYVAPSLKEVPVTVSFDKLPVEKAVGKLLRDFNFLASFKKVKGMDRLAVLKIYPKGTSSGNLVHIDTAKVEELGGASVLSDGETVRENQAPEGTRMMLNSPETPAEAKEATDSPFFAMQQQLEVEKQRSLEEQIRLQRLIRATNDPEKRKGLQMSYAEEIARVKKLEDSYTNKIESLKRQQEFAGERQ